jgi:hypothetical protein
MTSLRRRVSGPYVCRLMTMGPNIVDSSTPNDLVAIGLPSAQPRGRGGAHIAAVGQERVGGEQAGIRLQLPRSATRIYKGSVETGDDIPYIPLHTA